MSFTKTLNADVEHTKSLYYQYIFIWRNKSSVALFIIAVLNEAAEKWYRTV